MNEPRYPLSGPTPRHEALHEGIPIWLHESIRAWLDGALDSLARQLNHSDTGLTLARMFDLYARLEDPLAPKARGAYLWSVVMKRDDDLILDFLDFLLPMLREVGLIRLIDELERPLALGGSAWRVATRDGRPGLERRVGDTAIAAAEKAMSEAGHAGNLLEQAWQKVYGRHPDAKGAYSKAVLAVEEVAASLVIKNDLKPTLGKIASAMENQGDWRYVLHEGGRDEAKDAPLRQIQELWHRDPRHADGKGTYSDPSPEEAETAVFLAVGLVHLFRNGLIARKP